MASDWAGLPELLLDLILEKFASLSEYVLFSAVCIPWRHFALGVSGARHTKLQSLPMLMISKDDDADKYKRSLYSLAHQKVLDFQLPVPYKEHISSSCRGWLVTVNDDYSVTLYNPFSMMVHGNTDNSSIIHLPQLRGPPKPKEDEQVDEDWRPDPPHHVTKAAISVDPVSAPDDYAVMVIYGDCTRVAFIKPSRDTRWTYLDDKFTGMTDVTWAKGKFHAVNQRGTVVVCDVNTLPFNADYYTIPTRQEEASDVNYNTYIVESCTKELLMVERYIHYDYEDDEDRRETDGFKVFKLDLSGSEPNLILMKSLGDEALFLGDNSSLSVLASFTGCTPNSIYFTQDYDTCITLPFGPTCGPSDLGVFNMANGSFAPHYTPEDTTTLVKMMDRPPIWVVPTFHSKDKRGSL